MTIELEDFYDIFMFILDMKLDTFTKELESHAKAIEENLERRQNYMDRKLADITLPGAASHKVNPGDWLSLINRVMKLEARVAYLEEKNE